MFGETSVKVGARPIALGLVLAAALLGLFLAFGQGSTDHAEAAVGTTVGCSYVPDSGPFFNFKSACDAHDNCYIGHWLDKVGCDTKFLNDMRSYCTRTYQWWQWQRGPCLGLANTYYAGVATVGWGCYWNWIRC